MKPCAAGILAAGAASRWKNGPKALAPWRGRTLIDHACELARAAGCGPTYRVLGAHREAIEATSAPADVVTIFHPDWAEGLGSSLACGARAVSADPAADVCAGLIVLPCDQPLVSAATLLALRAEHERGGRGMVFSDHGAGRPGPPAFFARRHWAGLASLTGDSGARPLSSAHPEDCVLVPAPFAAEDIDTIEDHARLLAMVTG